MGFRIQKSINIGNILRINISKSGIGYSTGIAGLRVGTGPRGPYFSADLPGSGLSYRKHFGGRRKADQRVSSTKAQAEASPEVPDPGLFAPGHEKELVKGLQAYQAGQFEPALEHFLAAASDEPGAAMMAASFLAQQEDGGRYRAIELLEKIVQSDEEFPTELMQKYMASTEIAINITPNVTVEMPVNGLAATLLLVECYQAARRIREAIALLEEVEELSPDPVLTLSLCELYDSREIWEGIIDHAQSSEPVDDVTLEIAIYYGRAMQEKGLHEAAISVFSKALRKKKDRSPQLLREAAYWRAISYQAQGKSSQAQKEFEILYAEDPNFRDVAQRLDNLS
jgi:tetratricopeptide (TPR) repeat protein